MTASLATFRAVQGRLGVEPDVVIGHSVGEYAAIAAAESVDVGLVTRLVRERGMAMAASRAKGAMAAVLGLADEEVERLCAETDDVWPANYNCPGQVVISGREGGVAAVGEKARELGAKVVRLRVSGAFHSPLVEDAAQRLEPVDSRRPLRRAEDAADVDGVEQARDGGPDSRPPRRAGDGSRAVHAGRAGRSFQTACARSSRSARAEFWAGS